MAVVIPEGFGVYGPRGRDNARAVLDKTAELDRDPSEVKVHPSGYVVHKDVIVALGGKVEADGTEGEGTTESEESTEVEAPAQSADKDTWVAYAKTQGYDESEDLTKAKLIERFGAQGE